MPNADGQNTQEMLWQVESELKQLAHQLDQLNVVVRPYLDEIAELKKYRVQLLDLHETLQRRTIKPRIIVAERKVTTKTTTTSLDPSSQQLLDFIKKMSQSDLCTLCAQISNANGEVEEN